MREGINSRVEIYYEHIDFPFRDNVGYKDCFDVSSVQELYDIIDKIPLEEDDSNTAFFSSMVKYRLKMKETALKETKRGKIKRTQMVIPYRLNDTAFNLLIVPLSEPLKTVKDLRQIYCGRRCSWFHKGRCTAVEECRMGNDDKAQAVMLACDQNVGKFEDFHVLPERIYALNPETDVVIAQKDKSQLFPTPAKESPRLRNFFDESINLNLISDKLHVRE